MEESMISKTSTKLGICGGQFIPETLMPAIEELTAGLREVQRRSRIPIRMLGFSEKT